MSSPRSISFIMSRPPKIGTNKADAPITPLSTNTINDYLLYFLVTVLNKASPPVAPKDPIIPTQILKGKLISP